MSCSVPVTTFSLWSSSVWVAISFPKPKLVCVHLLSTIGDICTALWIYLKFTYLFGFKVFNRRINKLKNKIILHYEMPGDTIMQPFTNKLKRRATKNYNKQTVKSTSVKNRNKSFMTTFIHLILCAPQYRFLSVNITLEYIRMEILNILRNNWQNSPTYLSLQSIVVEAKWKFPGKFPKIRKLVVRVPSTAEIYLFKVSNESSRKIGEICANSTKITSER